MALAGTAKMLRRAHRKGYAVPGFCVWNAETIRTILQVATEQNAPVILMSGPGEFPLLPPSVLGRIARAEAGPLDIPVAVHLDHGDSLQMVAGCLDAGFTSVMLDASDHPFAENVKLTGRATEMARQTGADSEGEIGAMGRADDSSTEGAGQEMLTDPQEAAQFVAATGIDALAISIGNKHGIYPGLLELDFARLEQISAEVEVPLVLHGGSGTPDDDIQQAISLGIAKVNVASELMRAFATEWERQLSELEETPWVPLVMTETLGAIAAVARRWLDVTGASGQAKSGRTLTPAWRI